MPGQQSPKDWMRLGLIYLGPHLLCLCELRGRIGDASSDIELGQALGATTLLVRTGHGAETLDRGTRADHVVADLTEAASLIADLVTAPR